MKFKGLVLSLFSMVSLCALASCDGGNNEFKVTSDSTEVEIALNSLSEKREATKSVAGIGMTADVDFDMNQGENIMKLDLGMSMKFNTSVTPETFKDVTAVDQMLPLMTDLMTKSSYEASMNLKAEMKEGSADAQKADMSMLLFSGEKGVYMSMTSQMLGKKEEMKFLMPTAMITTMLEGMLEGLGGNGDSFLPETGMPNLPSPDELESNELLQQVLAEIDTKALVEMFSLKIVEAKKSVVFEGEIDLNKILDFFMTTEYAKNELAKLTDEEKAEALAGIDEIKAYNIKGYKFKFGFSSSNGLPTLVEFDAKELLSSIFKLSDDEEVKSMIVNACSVRIAINYGEQKLASHSTEGYTDMTSMLGGLV